MNKQYKLRSTGESIVILWRHDHPKGGDIYHCLLPPQAPGHKRRMQDINFSKIEERKV